MCRAKPITLRTTSAGSGGLVAHARRIAEQYTGFGQPAVPILEIIATVGSAFTGSDGDYSNKLPTSPGGGRVDTVDAGAVHPKVLIVHQFTPSMITNRQAISSTPNVQAVIRTDGFGSLALKRCPLPASSPTYRTGRPRAGRTSPTRTGRLRPLSLCPRRQPPPPSIGLRRAPKPDLELRRSSIACDAYGEPP